MKKIITTFIFCFLCAECFSQAGEWVWIHGSNASNSFGNYGIQGISSPLNEPVAAYEPCEFTDLNGNFWLFGGLDLTANFRGDLWKYDPVSNEWVWMKGSGAAGNQGSYGIQGVASPSNNPPSKGMGSTSWTDMQGNLWLFGGNGYPGPRNDLWKFNIAANEWTWMKGPGTPNQPGVYGTQGIPDSLNVPGARFECTAAWTDSANLWLFGGFNIYEFNDLWRYNIASNNWTWMKGSQLQSQQGVYGSLGVENSANFPGARLAPSHWKDTAGNFWLFGGQDLTNNINFNDLWRYNPLTNNWTWMGGSNIGIIEGLYVAQCVLLPGIHPSARKEGRAVWNDQNNNFWLFGGYLPTGYNYLNDLWTYNASTHQWMWVSGDSIFNPTGNWGALGVSSPSNKPSGRMGSVLWGSQNGQLYMFGGTSYPTGNYYNDLWKFTPDPACINTGISENNLADKLFIFPNPTNSSLTISFSSSENQTNELRIYNTLANQIYFSKQEITKGKFEKEINVEKMSGGIYFLQLKTKEGNMNRKVIINH